MEILLEFCSVASVFASGEGISQGCERWVTVRLSHGEHVARPKVGADAAGLELRSVEWIETDSAFVHSFPNLHRQRVEELGGLFGPGDVIGPIRQHVVT